MAGHNELVISNGLDVIKNDGNSPDLGRDDHDFQHTIMHELAHKLLENRPDRYGKRGATADQLLQLERRLGFTAANFRWLVKGKNDDSGNSIWYTHTADGWKSCDGNGRIVSQKLYTDEEMQNLTKIHYPTTYFTNPEDLICESLPAIWIGGKAREHLAVTCPEVYSWCVEEDIQAIKELNDANGTHFVRGLDGRLLIDSPEYRIQIATFNKRILMLRSQMQAKNAKVKNN